MALGALNEFQLPNMPWHLSSSSGAWISRLMFQIFPILLFWLFTLLLSPRNLFAAKLLADQTAGGIEYAAHD